MVDNKNIFKLKNRRARAILTIPSLTIRPSKTTQQQKHHFYEYNHVLEVIWKHLEAKKILT